jgi:hypothetical protein
MLKFLGYTLMSLAISANAQDQVPCPVKISRVILSRPSSISDLGLDNLTDKAISGVKLELVYLDKVKEEHPSMVTIVSDGMKPRKWTNYSWHTNELEYVRGPFLLRVQKILYKDDSVWLPPVGFANPCVYSASR